MQLIINCPTDKKGIEKFNTRFAQVQKELILHCIRELSVDTLSKKKILNNIANELKIQANKKEIKELSL